MKFKANEAHQAISLARKQTLDTIEGAFGDHPQWPFVRSRILKIFGREGLGKNIYREGQPDGCNNGEVVNEQSKRNTSF